MSTTIYNIELDWVKIEKIAVRVAVILLAVQCDAEAQVEGRGDAELERTRWCRPKRQRDGIGTLRNDLSRTRSPYCLHVHHLNPINGDAALRRGRQGLRPVQAGAGHAGGHGGGLHAL